MVSALFAYAMMGLMVWWLWSTVRAFNIKEWIMITIGITREVFIFVFNWIMPLLLVGFILKGIA